MIVKYSVIGLVILFFFLFFEFFFCVSKSSRVNVSDTNMKRLEKSRHEELKPTWLVNLPKKFLQDMISWKGLEDDDEKGIVATERYLAQQLATVTSVTDGEDIDCIEHFFWNKRSGISIEMGALDGSPRTYSMTHGLESFFDWKRILIEGNPSYRESMPKYSPHALSINAAICEKEGPIHYVVNHLWGDYVSGIIEFMEPDFLATFHPSLKYDRSTGQLIVSDEKLETVYNSSCIRLSTALALAKVVHVNYFLLDVEGAEMAVLKGIDWNHITFDVMSIETGGRSFANELKSVMKLNGYLHYADAGRNSWFTHPNFVLSSRPGINHTTWTATSKIWGK